MGKQLNDIEQLIIDLKHAHRYTWQLAGEYEWWCGLEQEIDELKDALFSHHNDSPDHELAQIAAIALNWLEYRNCNPITLRESLSKHFNS